MAKTPEHLRPDPSVIWEDAPTEFVRRFTHMGIYGDTGTGRTSLALTAPGPIGLAHTAEKIDGVVQQHSKEKVIRVVNFGGVFSGSPQQIAEQANPKWEALKVAWNDGVDNWAKTVVMDTDTEAWEILRLARFGTLAPKGRMDNLYGPVNAEWRGVIKRHRLTERCNVITIGQAKDEYIEKKTDKGSMGQRTGRTVRAGQKEIPYMADVIVRTHKTYADDGGVVFSAVIEKGWFNAFIEGMEVFGDEVRFSYIMSLVTETDEEEWL